MVTSDKSTAIYTAFDRWLDTKSLSLIEEFTREELETALIECVEYKDMPPYLAIEGRVEQLKDIERRRAGKRRTGTISRKLSFWEKLKWALIGALLSFVAAIVILFFSWEIIKHWFE